MNKQKSPSTKGTFISIFADEEIIFPDSEDEDEIETKIFECVYGTVPDELRRLKKCMVNLSEAPTDSIASNNILRLVNDNCEKDTAKNTNTTEASTPNKKFRSPSKRRLSANYKTSRKQKLIRSSKKTRARLQQVLSVDGQSDLVNKCERRLKERIINCEASISQSPSSIPLPLKKRGYSMNAHHHQGEANPLGFISLQSTIKYRRLYSPGEYLNSSRVEVEPTKIRKLFED